MKFNSSLPFPLSPFLFHLHDLKDFLEGFDFLEAFHDDVHFVAVVHTEFEGAFEDAVVGGDGDAVDVDAELVADDFGHIMEKALTVDTPDGNGGIEEEFFVHLPFGIKDAIAKAGLELGGNGAGALMDFYAAPVVDIAEDIVAGNGVAAVGIDVLRIGIFGDDDGLLLVKVFTDDEKALVFRSCNGTLCFPLFGFLLAVFRTFLCFSDSLFFFLVFAKEGHELFEQAATGGRRGAGVELCKVVVAKDDGLAADGLQELLVLAEAVELAKAVEHGGGHFNAVFLEPGKESSLAFFLLFASFSAQDGLNFCLGLGGGDKVDP